ncbi:MAG: DUF6597 domain-containing transcriptional factor [Mangrovibacterium sp.]
MISIRHLYKPVQPVAGHSPDMVSYSEAFPDERLQPFIYCYWELKSTEKLLTPYQYNVVTDGCIDIFFDRNDPFESRIMGLSNTCTEFPLTPSFHYSGIRFLPGMFPLIFRLNASELSNRVEDLENVLPRASSFIKNQMNEQTDFGKVRRLLDTFFLRLPGKVQFNADQRFFMALKGILQTNGTLRIEKDLDTGISPRQLRRLFEYYIGDTAKTFSMIVRFQHILRASALNSGDKKLFYDAGYYDQAHFIREFSNFYGETPGKVFVR